MFVQSLSQRILAIGLLTGLLCSFSLVMLPATTEARPLGRPKGISKTGAVRGACPAIDTKLQNRKLIALVDSNDPTLTTQAYPKFWLYLPFTRTEDVTTAEFELLNENQDSVLTKRKINVSLAPKAGIVSFTLPSGEKPLEVGKEYFWVFRVVCDKDDRSSNPTVTGWIKRVEPKTTLVSQLKSIPKTDQYKVYEANKIWFDQINLLAQYRTKHNQVWTNLLTSFGLGEFAQQPINELKLEGN